MHSSTVPDQNTVKVECQDQWLPRWFRNTAPTEPQGPADSFKYRSTNAQRSYLGLKSSKVRCQSEDACQCCCLKRTGVYSRASGIGNAADKHVWTLLVVPR